MAGGLSWRHHTLIQTLLSRGPLMEHDFHSIFSNITGKNPGTHQQLLNDYLLKINKELSYVKFELRACRNQYDANVYYGVVNTIADEQSKLGTKYSVPQIAFYKGIIESIVQDVAAQGIISNIDALNTRLENQVPTTGAGSQSQGGPSQVPPAIKNFSLSQKEKSLEELVRDQWLCSTSDGKIGLGVRSFLDLRSWFHSNDVPACEVCNEAGIKAELCQNEGCAVRIHRYCLKKKFSQTMGERVCPGCRNPWLPPLSKTEAKVEEDDPTEASQNLPPSQPSTRKRPRTGGIVEADAVGSNSSQPSVPGSNMKRLTRSSARLG